MNLWHPRRVMKIVPSRPAGGRLAWSLPLRGPQASHPRKNHSPKGPPQPEKGVSGEEPLPPSGDPGGSAPWCSFFCFLQRKQAPPRAVAPRRWHLQLSLPTVGKSLPLRTAHRFDQPRWSPAPEPQWFGQWWCQRTTPSVSRIFSRQTRCTPGMPLKEQPTMETSAYPNP